MHKSKKNDGAAPPGAERKGSAHRQPRVKVGLAVAVRAELRALAAELGQAEATVASMILTVGIRRGRLLLVGGGA
jgi:hypothetical protein